MRRERSRYKSSYGGKLAGLEQGYLAAFEIAGQIDDLAHLVARDLNAVHRKGVTSMENLVEIFLLPADRLSILALPMWVRPMPRSMLRICRSSSLKG